MNASKRASHAYAEWIDKQAIEFINEERLPEQTVESYLQANARFITLTFDKRMIARRKSELAREICTAGISGISA
jgi:Fe-S cluster biosynthesis and repair protein YggX